MAPDKASVEGFLEKFRDTPGSLYNATAFLREFSRYLTARGIPAYLIPSGRLRLPTPVQPYFFTEGEITAFFRECDRIKADPHLKGRHLVLPAIFRLLYCCGLRCKEARTLARRNVHLDEGYLDLTTNTGNIFEKIGIGTSVHYSLVAIDVKDLNDPPHAFILNTGVDPIGLPNLGSNGCLVLQQNPGNTNYYKRANLIFIVKMHKNKTSTIFRCIL